MTNRDITKALNELGSATVHRDPPEVIADRLGRFILLVLAVCSAPDDAEVQTWDHRWADSDLELAATRLRCALPRSLDAILFENGIEGVETALAFAASPPEERKRLPRSTYEAYSQAAALAYALLGWAAFCDADKEEAAAAAEPKASIKDAKDEAPFILEKALAIPVDGRTVADTMAGDVSLDRDPFITAYILHDLSFPPLNGALGLAGLHLARVGSDPEAVGRVALAIRCLLSAGARGEQLSPGFDADHLSALCFDALIPLVDAVGRSMPTAKVITGLSDLDALIQRLRWREPPEAASVLMDRLDRLALFADELDAIHRRRRIGARGAPLARAKAIYAAQAELLHATPLN